MFGGVLGRPPGGGRRTTAVVAVSSGVERSSLVLGENNSTRPEDAVNGENGDEGRGQSCSNGGEERYDCRHTFQNFEFENEEGDTAPYRCGSWECYCCGYSMRMNLVEEIGRICENRPEMRRMMTLTVDPKKAPDGSDEQHRYLTERWNALRTALSRRYDDFSFIWVREEGEKSETAHPHLHIIINQYVPQEWLSATWSELGGGEVVDIRYLDRVEKAAHYVGKYLTKNALSGLPDGIRRYGSSSDLELDVRGDGGESEDDWRLLMDDYQIYDGDKGPLRRGVSAADFVRQREWNGPQPPPDG